jgi:N-acetylglutamate synthase-like GNAT family acetyltransferase
MNLFRPSKSDLPEINSLIIDSKKSWGYTKEQIESWIPDLIATAKTLENREYWLAKNQDNVSVFVYSISCRETDIYELEDCWVSPKMKGKGFGRIMFMHLVSNLRDKNAKKLKIVSDPNAKGFYLAMGAQIVGQQSSNLPNRFLPVLELQL